jgi:hypothetical protein
MAYSINEIARLLHRTYPYVHKKVTELLKDGILSEVALGNVRLCSINLANDDAILLLALNASKKKQIFLKKNAKLQTVVLALSTLKGMRTMVSNGQDLFLVADEPLVLSAVHAKIMTCGEFQDYYVVHKDQRKDLIVLSSFESYFLLLKDIQGKLRMEQLFPKS